MPRRLCNDDDREILTNPLTVARFSEEAVDPVEDVEATVHAEEEDIVTCHVVNVARPLQEDQLRQDGHSLEVDGEGPQQLHDGELVVDEEREDGARHDEKEDAKGVLLTVIRRPHNLVVPHVVHNGARGTKENQLHDRVVPSNINSHTHSRISGTEPPLQHNDPLAFGSTAEKTLRPRPGISSHFYCPTAGTIGRD
jgi:hypothetical protein